MRYRDSENISFLTFRKTVFALLQVDFRDASTLQARWRSLLVRRKVALGNLYTEARPDDQPEGGRKCLEGMPLVQN